MHQQLGSRVGSAHPGDDPVAEVVRNLCVQMSDKLQGAHEVWGSRMLVAEQALADSEHILGGPGHQLVGLLGDVWCHDGGQVRVQLRPDQRDAVPVAYRDRRHQLQAHLHENQSMF